MFSNQVSLHYTDVGELTMDNPYRSNYVPVEAQKTTLPRYMHLTVVENGSKQAGWHAEEPEETADS